MYSITKRHSSVTPIPKFLNWQPLLSGRKQAKAITMCLIVNSLVALPAYKHLGPTGSRTRVNDICFLSPNTRVQAYKLSFFPYANRFWNWLPSNVINRHILNGFRESLCSVRPEMWKTRCLWSILIDAPA